MVLRWKLISTDKFVRCAEEPRRDAMLRYWLAIEDVFVLGPVIKQELESLLLLRRQVRQVSGLCVEKKAVHVT